MANPWKEIGRYGGVGLELVLTILIVAGAGRWLDGRYFGGSGWATAVGFLVGVAVAFRNLVRTAKEMQRDIERAEAKDPAAHRWTTDESWTYKDDARDGAGTQDPDDSQPEDPQRSEGRREKGDE